MKKNILILLTLIIVFVSCQPEINLPKNFTKTNINVTLVIDKACPFYVGFINPSYYYSDKTKQNVTDIVNAIKPLNYTLNKIELLIKEYFKDTGFNITGVIKKQVPHLKNTYDGPSTREPVINPEIDLEKIKSKIKTKYIALFYIKYFRMEFDVRPGTYNRFILEPVLVLYDTEAKKKIYLSRLRLPLQSKKAKTEYRLKGFVNSKINIELIKKHIDKLVKTTIDKLAKSLRKRFS